MPTGLEGPCGVSGGCGSRRWYSDHGLSWLTGSVRLRRSTADEPTDWKQTIAAGYFIAPLASVEIASLKVGVVMCSFVATWRQRPPRNIQQHQQPTGSRSRVRSVLLIFDQLIRSSQSNLATRRNRIADCRRHSTHAAIKHEILSYTTSILIIRQQFASVSYSSWPCIRRVWRNTIFMSACNNRETRIK